MNKKKGKSKSKSKATSTNVAALWKKKWEAKEYADLAFRRQPAKGSPIPIAVETAKDVVLGAVAGSFLATTIFGKYSFWSGLALTVAGHATGLNMLSATGVGMMASGGKNVTGISGTEEMDGFSMENFKARSKDFVSNWKEKLAPGIPKLSKDEATDSKPVGEVQVYNYPQNEINGLEELDKLEAQLVESAAAFERSQQGAMGDSDEVFGDVYDMGSTDPIY